MTIAVSIENLEYVYPDGTRALDRVSLNISEGELVVILGPNGAGKSTLLLHLNGILTGGGTVRIFGKDIRDKKRSELVREVGIVFQNPDDQLFMPTIFDDVAFGPLNMNLSEDEVKERVRNALRDVNMEEFTDRCPHHLSFGEKKKASIATILSINPCIIALDEPTTNLDPMSRRELIKIIKKLRSGGKTIIIATHDIEAIADIADRIYILNKRIIASGTPKEILLDFELLKNANLEVPTITILFEVLSHLGYNPENPPLSLDEAINHLTKTIETEGGHIHLHIHEHSHEEIERVKKKYNHHL